jgi:hypothetical protein
MYDEVMKVVFAIVSGVAIYGGVLAIIEFFRKPYRKEIKAFADTTLAIQGDDWSRMQKMDTRLTAEIKALVDSRIPAVVCSECGCLVADGSQRKKQRVTYRDQKGFPVSPDVIMKRLDSGDDYSFVRNVTVLDICNRCAAEFEKKSAVKTKEKSK